MPSENSADECYSQGDKSDGALDLMSMIQEESKDLALVVVESDTSPKEATTLDANNDNAKSIESTKTNEPLKPTTTDILPQVSRAHPITQAESKTFSKQNKPNQRKTNNRFRSSNRRSSFKSNKSNNSDTVDKWKHDKYEMMYNGACATYTNDSDVFNVEENQQHTNTANVEEIQGCIVSKLQSLTLSSSPDDEKSNVQSSKMDDSKDNRSNTKNRDFHYNKTHKPSIPVVVTDNTKKFNERKSPTFSSPPQTSAQQQFAHNGTTKNHNGEISSAHANPPRPHVVTSNAHRGQTPPTINTTINTTISRHPKNKPTSAYHPRTTTKRYFEPLPTTIATTATSSNTTTTTTAAAATTSSSSRPANQLTNNFRPNTQTFNGSYNNNNSFNGSYNNNSFNDPMSYQPLYYADQNYYYYQNPSPYYPTADMMAYQTPVYFQPDYSTQNAYYNENQAQIPYFNQQMYNEGLYYQPPLDAYYSPEQQQYYDTSRGNYRWNNGRTNYQQHRTPRRH